MTNPPPKRRTVSRKSGKNAFYSRGMSETELRDLSELQKDSLEPELNLLRVLIRRLAASDDSEADLKTRQELLRTIAKACETLERLVKTQASAGKGGESELRQALDQAIEELGREWGLDERFPRA